MLVWTAGKSESSKSSPFLRQLSLSRSNSELITLHTPDHHLNNHILTPVVTKHENARNSVHKVRCARRCARDCVREVDLGRKGWLRSTGRQGRPWQVLGQAAGPQILGVGPSFLATNDETQSWGKFWESHKFMVTVTV